MLLLAGLDARMRRSQGSMVPGVPRRRMSALARLTCPVPAGVAKEAGSVLADVAALAPPLLVCAAFLIAVWAFLRHEMRGAKNPGGEDEVDEPSTQRDSGESA